MPIADPTAQEQSGQTVERLLEACAAFVDRAVSGADAEELADLYAVTLGEEPALPLICRLAGSDPHLLDLPPVAALAAQLRMLVAVAGLADASVWVLGDSAAPVCVAAVSSDEPGEAARDAAGRLLAEIDQSGGTGKVAALPVRYAGRPVAALVLRGEDRLTERTLDAGREMAAAVAPVLATATLREGAADGRTLSEAANRRLARLGFDIHDGPLQDTVALLADVRFYRRQLTQELPAGDAREPLIQRVDDFEARLLALVDELRELAESFEPIGVVSSDLREVIAREVESFRLRGGVEVKLEVDLDTDSLTASQRITIVRIVQEALANIRDYSEAHNVSIKAVQLPGFVRIDVADDGKGFDVGPTLARARRQRRLGLAGMNERVRLLGGEFTLESAPGAGTTISVVLPEWSPEPAA